MLNSRLFGTHIGSFSSWADIKSALLNLANGDSIKNGEMKCIRFYTSFTDGYFTNGNTYQGFIMINSQSSTYNYFSVLLIGVNGVVIQIGYTNGTWNVYQPTRAGEFVAGTNYTPYVGNGGANAHISVMNLTRGTWILFCNGYSPIMQNNKVESQATTGHFEAMSGSVDLRGPRTSLLYSFSLCGSAIVHSDTARIDFVVINWESYDVAAAGAAYGFVALRIA